MSEGTPTRWVATPALRVGDRLTIAGQECVIAVVEPASGAAVEATTLGPTGQVRHVSPCVSRASSTVVYLRDGTKVQGRDLHVEQQAVIRPAASGAAEGTGCLVRGDHASPASRAACLHCQVAALTADLARANEVIAGTAYPSDATLTREQAFHGWAVANRQRDAYAERERAALQRAEAAERDRDSLRSELGDEHERLTAVRVQCGNATAALSAAREALRALLATVSKSGEESEWVEREGMRFWRETGVWPYFKSAPLEMHHDRDDEARMRRWGEWCRAQRDAAIDRARALSQPGREGGAR